MELRDPREIAELVEATRADIVRRAGGGHRLKGRRRRAIPNAQAARALRESGLSARTVEILVEGDAHERASAAAWGAPPKLGRELPPAVDRALAALSVLQEDAGAVGDGTGTACDACMPPAGWTARDGGVYTHPKLLGHKLMTDASGAWRHHDGLGRIVSRGQGQKSLTEYLKTVAYQDAPSESADEGPAFDVARLAAAFLLTPTLTESERNAHRLLERKRTTADHAPAEAHRVARAALDRRDPRPTPEAARLLAAVRKRTAPTGGADLHERMRRAIGSAR